MNATNIGFTILLWATYFFLHSFLADDKIKRNVTVYFGLSARGYRLFYSIISIIGLLPIFAFLAIKRSEFMIPKSEFLQFISLALCTWGIIIIKQSFRNYKIREFLGLSNAETEKNFTRSGILNYVRHPIYSGTILLTFGFWLFIPNLLNFITVMCIVLYLIIGIRLEERKLIKMFGQRYLDYKKEVPAIFPSIKKFLN